MALKPIGFDMPGVQLPTVNAPQTLPQPDTTALQVLSQTSQRFDQTLQFDTQVAQQQVQATNDMMQAANRATQSVAETTAQAMQARAQRSQQNAQTVSNLAENVMRYTQQYAERQAKKDEATAKAEQAAQQAAATQALEDLRVNWIEKGEIDRQGTSAYRDAVAETISRYGVDSEFVEQATQRYYQPALDYAQRVEENRQREITDAAKAQRNITSTELQLKMSNALAGLQANVPLDPSMVNVALGHVRTHIKDLMGNEQIPLSDRLFAVGNALEVTQAALAKRNVNSIEFNALVRDTRTVRQLEAELIPQVRAGQLPESEYKALVEQRALELGLRDFKVSDPNTDVESTYRTLNLNRQIKNLQQENFADQVSTIAVQDNVVGALVTRFALSPEALANAERDPTLKTDRNTQTALELAKRWQTFTRETLPQFSRQDLELQQQERNIDANYREWYINARRSAEAGQQVLSPAKLLEQLRGFSPEVAAISPGRPLTMADVEVVAGAARLRLEGLAQQRANLKGQLENQRAEFEQYGLSTDVGKMRAANQRQQKFLDDHNARLNELRLQQMQAPQQPGQPTNFRGAALVRKPLARASYGGASITMPFAPNAAATIPNLSQGQSFGASRDDGARRHQGLDFAVPTGTPTLAMVPGRIISVKPNHGGYGISIEMLGDDGYRYFYAHTDKTLAQVNQRVNAGDAIALSGNTGVGSGPHLHLEVTDPNGKIINPLQHLASRDFTNPPQVRGAGSSRPTMAPGVIPKGAIPLGGNRFLVGSQVVTLNYQQNNPQTQAKPATYSTAAPLRNSYAGAKREGNDPEANHGYAVLANDRDFARRLNALSRKYGLNPEWLVDVIAHETGNTFDPAEPNGVGHYGLIQFGPPAMADLGVTKEQLTRMTRNQQLQLVDRYLALQIRYAGIGNIRSAEELAAIVFMGGQGAADLRRTGRVGSELSEYLNMMGRFGGRQYRHQGNRRQRASSVIHERPVMACTVCANMLSDRFLPHESQELNA